MDIIGQLLKQIDSIREEIRDSLAKGHVVNFETYNRLVGNYQALEEVKELINNILQEDEEGNE